MKLPELSLAPMAGYSDAAFRGICRHWGAEMTYSEMIAARAVLMGTAKLPEDACVIQLFGADPSELAEAAELVERRAVWINLNVGCPVKKVVKKGAGAALLKDLRRLRMIVREMRKRIKKALSVKIRIGWEKDETERIVALLVEEGVDLVEIHGRTATQMYSGRAKRDVFERIKRTFEIPVFASGDIYTPEDAEELLNKGVNGVLFARGAVGKPWIFKATRLWLEKRERYNPSLDERRATVLKHLRLLAEEKGERKAVLEFRKFIVPYTRGMRGAKEFRKLAMKLEDFGELYCIFDEFFSSSFSDQHGLQASQF